jgi:peptidoglycan/LPS O-acetylase OafA/YrhL
VTEPELARGDRDQALDGLRAIAALMVVFYHCGVEFRLRPFFIPGFTGVHLFFVLSGYLISRPFLARMVAGQPLPSRRRYAARRFVRIYPTYFVALIVFIAMRFAGHLHAPSHGDMLRHALLIFNWGKPAEFFTINIVMWTLAIEAQFYVILPIAAALAYTLGPGRGRLGALLLVLAFVVVGLVSRGLEYSMTRVGDVRFRLPFSFLDLFAMGIFAAYLELTQATFLRQRLTLRATLVLCALALLFASNHWLVAAGGSDWLTPPRLAIVCLYPIGICAAFALIVLGLRTRARYEVPVLTSAPLTFVGRISYSMYLYHVGVGYFLLTRLPPGPGLWLGSHPKVYALAQLGPVIIVSYLAYLAIELPSLRWVERFSLRARERKHLTSS